MAEHMIVKTTDDCPAVKTICDTDSINLCKICIQEIAKYTCPRCNMTYCSVPCYQSEKHAACSEAFYKDCVINELKDINTSSQDRERVMKMLSEDLEQRAQEESDEDQVEDLEDRLHGLDIDNDTRLVWSRLTQKEKEDFARMLQDGRLARLIEMWTPWWRRKENYKLVTELHKKVPHPDKGHRNIPDVLEDIPDINTLLKNTSPSSDCRFDLINILYSYCFVSRVHNGCHMECPVDSIQDILESCAVLRNQYRCGSIGEAIQKAFDDVCKKDRGTEESFSQKFNLTVLEDVKIIICGPGQIYSLAFISAALSDFIMLLRSALVIVSKELKSLIRSASTESSELKTLKSQVFKSEKKLIFLLSWLQCYGSSMHQLVPLLEFEIETRQSEVEEVEDIKTLVEKNMDRLKPSNNVNEGDHSQESCPQKIIELN